ncbi:MAG: plastocyanin [Candidatus Methanoperedens sp.]|nr:plastocyanin [Candidatus Methanoperedens sp.]
MKYTWLAGLLVLVVLISGCTSEPISTPQPTQPAPTRTVEVTMGVTPTAGVTTIATPTVTATMTVGVTSTARATPTATATPTAQTVSVEIKDFKFNPATLNITRGTTVTWTQRDSAPHTVTATSGESFDSGSLNQGQTYSYTFDRTGTFVYGCTIHPTMSGTIRVTERLT